MPGLHAISAGIHVFAVLNQKLTDFSKYCLNAYDKPQDKG